jgi:hypothetical protein
VKWRRGADASTRNPWKWVPLVLRLAPKGRKSSRCPYSQLLLPTVFSTKGRAPWITAEVAERLYPYIGGIVSAEKGVLYDIGGVEDHVHLDPRWRPNDEWHVRRCGAILGKAVA